MNVTALAKDLLVSVNNEQEEDGLPKVTGIRNLKKLPSYKKIDEYTFEFEAEIDGEWIQYGPDVCMNFALRSDLEPEHAFTDSLTGLVYIGLRDLNNLYRAKEEAIEDVEAARMRAETKNALDPLREQHRAAVERAEELLKEHG